MSDLERNGPERGKPGLRRSLRIVLFVSLALNLLVAGLVAGAILHAFGGDHPRPPFAERPGGPMTAALSRADKIAIGRALRQADRAERPSRAEITAEYEAVIAALTAEPYDAQAVRAAVERQMAGLQRRAELGKDLLLDRLDEMSDAERAAFAERLREVLQRGPRKTPRDGRRDGWLDWQRRH